MISERKGNSPTFWFRLCRVRQKELQRIDVVTDIPTWSIFEDVSQVFIWIQTIFFRGFDEAEHNCGGFCSAWGVCEEKILLAYHKRLDAALGTIIRDFEPTVEQKMLQIFALRERIVNGQTQSGFGYSSITVRPVVTRCLFLRMRAGFRAAAVRGPRRRRRLRIRGVHGRAASDRRRACFATWRPGGAPPPASGPPGRRE